MQSLQKLTSKTWQLTVIIYAIRVYDIKAINDLKFIAKALKFKNWHFNESPHNSLHIPTWSTTVTRSTETLSPSSIRLVLFNQHKTLRKDGDAFFNSGGHGHIGPPDKKSQGAHPSPPPPVPTPVFRCMLTTGNLFIKQYHASAANAFKKNYFTHVYVKKQSGTCVQKIQLYRLSVAAYMWLVWSMKAFFIQPIDAAWHQ